MTALRVGAAKAGGRVNRCSHGRGVVTSDQTTKNVSENS